MWKRSGKAKMSFRTTKVKSQNFPFRLSQHRGHRETLNVDVYSVWVLCRKLHSSSVYVRYWHLTICDSWICWKKLKTLQLCGPLATKDGVEGPPFIKLQEPRQVMMQRHVWSDNSHDNMATQVPTQLIKEGIGDGNLRTTSKCSPQRPQVQESFF